jgi:hypothetical protein
MPTAAMLATNAVSNEMANYPNFYRLFQQIVTIPQPPNSVLLAQLRAAWNELANFPITRYSLCSVFAGGPFSSANVEAIVAELQGTFPTFTQILVRLVS